MMDRQGSTSAEIEVTAAMEAAGIRALAGFDSSSDCPGEYVRLVFKAMALAAIGKKPPDQDQVQGRVVPSQVVWIGRTRHEL